MKLWAVCHDGIVWHWTIRRIRRDAIAAFMEDSNHRTWQAWKAMGHRCKRVTVTIDEVK